MKSASVLPEPFPRRPETVKINSYASPQPDLGKRRSAT